MTRHRARAHVGLASAATLAMGLLWGAGGTPVTAQGTPPGAAASGACAGLVELLPPQLNGTALQSHANVGSEADPDTVGPLLQAVGVTPPRISVWWCSGTAATRPPGAS